MRIALFVAGPKGANFLRDFSGAEAVDVVVSYASKGLQYDAYADIQAVCRSKNYKLVERADVRADDYAAADLVLLIGWQWMSSDVDKRFVVFHDSLLPKLRGFNPTVTALIAGETDIGVTAFSPAGGDAAVPDSGPIFGQEQLPITYPVTIREVYEQLGLAYCRLADRVLAAAAAGPLQFLPQDAANATYSLWRDEDDYRIDWAKTAADIHRFVDAVGWPYLGAKTTMQGRDIRIDRVEPCPDVVFVNRCPGKIWSLADGGATVVCGSGLMRITAARDADGSPVRFTSLRVRLA
jgi:methionyl-tRNA formyltransferase